MQNYCRQKGWAILKIGGFSGPFSVIEVETKRSSNDF